MTEATQSTFAELEYAAKKWKTRRERFLERMDCLIPWRELEGGDPPALSEGGPAVAGGTPCRRCCECIACSCSTT